MTVPMDKTKEVPLRILFLLPEFVVVCCFCMAESPQECEWRQTPLNGEQQGTEQVGMSGEGPEVSTGDAAESIGVNLWWKWSLFCSIDGGVSYLYTICSRHLSALSTCA